MNLQRVKNASGILQGRKRIGAEAGPTKFSAENYGWLGTTNKKGFQRGWAPLEAISGLKN